MCENDWIWSNEQHIAGSPAAMDDVIQGVLRQLEAGGWSRQNVYSVHLALQEALSNAVNHGHQRDSSKRIRVACRKSHDTIRIEVADEGSGFSPEDVPDPTSKENLTEPSGRGIMLMRRFMSRVSFGGCGNRITLELDRSRDR